MLPSAMMENLAETVGDHNEWMLYLEYLIEPTMGDEVQNFVTTREPEGVFIPHFFPHFFLVVFIFLQILRFDPSENVVNMINHYSNCEIIFLKNIDFSQNFHPVIQELLGAGDQYGRVSNCTDMTSLYVDGMTLFLRLTTSGKLDCFMKLEEIVPMWEGQSNFSVRIFIKFFFKFFALSKFFATFFKVYLKFIDAFEKLKIVLK